MNDLTLCSATSIAAAIRRKDLSSLEVMDAHLDHIQRVNPPLNAVVRVLAESARREARAADEALARGDCGGPFHGVPMTVKDAWELAGVPSTGGTLGRAAFVPEHDATVIARMRSAGAIPIGMTNLPELSFAYESDNLVHGRTKNPYNLARTPGGSGGGGAAAIAAGMSPIEIGADLGGSIRLPCHFSGIAGIRWHHRTRAHDRVLPALTRLGSTILRVRSNGPQRRRSGCGAAGDRRPGFGIRLRNRGRSLARLEDSCGQRAACRGTYHQRHHARPRRRQRDGHECRQGPGRRGRDRRRSDSNEQCLEIFFGIANADGGEGLRAALAMAGTERLHPLMETGLALAAAHQPAGVLQSLWVRVDLYRSAMLSFLKNYDLILSPVNALPAIEHGTSFHPDVLPAFSYTIAHNLTGWPGAVVRCGTSAEGLPIGVQAVARPWREDIALAAVQHLEAALGGYQRPPLAVSA